MALFSRTIRLLLVHHDARIRQAIAMTLSRSDDLVVVGEADSHRAGVETFSALRPEVALVDLQLPRRSGMDLIERMSDAGNVIIIALAHARSDDEAIRARRAGAHGYVHSGALASRLADTVRTLVLGDSRDSGEADDGRPQIGSFDLLTGRELEVLRNVAAGHTNREVASLMTISDETVKGHMKNIAIKLGARHRTHAVALAFMRGIIAVG